MPFSFIRCLLFFLYFSNKIFLISEELHLVSSIPNVIDEREAANRIEISNKKHPDSDSPIIPIYSCARDLKRDSIFPFYRRFFTILFLRIASIRINIKSESEYPNKASISANSILNSSDFSKSCSTISRNLASLLSISGNL